MIKIVQFINYIIFLLAISTVLTALPDLLFPMHIPYKEFILTPFLEVIFLIMLFNFSKIKINKKFLFIYFLLILPIFISYIFEPIRSLYLMGREPAFIMVNFINILVFFVFYIINLALDKEFYYKSLKVYWRFNYFIVIVAVIVFIALHLQLIHLNSWKLPSFFSEHFHIKLNILGATSELYSVPFYLTVILPQYLKPFGFFSEFGTFSGLSYEPHIATFFMTPAFFLTYYYYKFNIKNFFIYYFPFFIFFMLTSSVTNFIGLSLTGLFILIFSINIKILKKILLSCIVIIVIGIFYWDTILEIWFLFEDLIKYKLNSRSSEETNGFISYILSPKSIIGWGAFNIPTYFSDNKVDDIGLIGSILVIIFYIQILSISIINIINKNTIFSAIGIYIFIHSMKFPLNTWQLPYLLFILALISYPLVYKREIKMMRYKPIKLFSNRLKKKNKYAF